MERAHDVVGGTDRAALARMIMRKQARLGLRIAAVFVLILAGLPLLNLYLPDLMATGVGGFTLTWLFLAVLFYPVTWLLSWLFVRGSDRIEESLVTELREKISSSSLPTPDPGSSVPKSEKRKLFVEEEEA